MNAKVRRPARVPRAGCWPRGRCLHLIDLESLAGADYASAGAARGRNPRRDELLRLTWASYQSVIGIQRGDHAMLGLRAAPCGRLSDLLASSGTQLRVARDARGVRAALANSVDVEHAARRFDWLVIAGGHETFAELASSARGSGMRIWLVGGTRPVAPALAAISDHRCRLLLHRAAA